MRHCRRCDGCRACCSRIQPSDAKINDPGADVTGAAKSASVGHLTISRLPSVLLKPRSPQGYITLNQKTTSGMHGLDSLSSEASRAFTVHRGSLLRHVVGFVLWATAFARLCGRGTTGVVAGRCWRSCLLMSLDSFMRSGKTRETPWILSKLTTIPLVSLGSKFCKWFMR
jgi:hypothetical protein